MKSEGHLPVGRLLVGVVLGAVCLVIALWGVRPEDVLAKLAATQLGWLGLAVVSVLLVAVTKAARWRALLRFAAPAPVGASADAVRPSRESPGGPPAMTPFRPVFEVLLVAQMLNIIIPVRIGELVRMILLNRLGGPSQGAILSTIAIEKLIDLVFTIVLALLVLPLVVTAAAFQGSIEARVGISLGIALAACAALLAVRHWRRRFMAWFAAQVTPRLPAAIRRPVARLTDATLATLDALSHRRALVIVGGWSLVVWLFSALSYYLLLQALQLNVPALTPLVLLAAMQLGVVPPSPPGLIGVTNVIAQGVVQAFGVPAASAVAFGFVTYVVLVTPPVMLGAFFLGEHAAYLPAWRSLFALRVPPGRDVAPAPEDRHE